MKPMEFRGRWLLVTGASSGLGREMARILATEHGANLFLTARRADRLEALKAELERDAGVSVATMVADLSKLEDVDRVLEEATSKHELYGTILNAGVTHFGPYTSLSWDVFRQMLDTNVTSVVRMATAVVPHLEAREGGLMLVSSLAGIVPVAYQTAYSSTKAFLVHFGSGLWHELQGKPISVTTYAPGGIVSEMTAGENFVPLKDWLMPCDRVAREGIDAMRKRKYLHIPGASNRIGTALANLAPRRFVTSIVAATYRNALKKQNGST